MNEKIEKAIEAAKDVIEFSEYYDRGGEYWYSSSVNLWEKYGKCRIYINMDYGRSRKWNRGVSFCVDVDKEEIFNNSKKYNNAGERRVTEAAAKAALNIIKK
jgi:hypothetical protein